MIKIHDNGGIPYEIDILDEKTVKIYKQSNDKEYTLIVEYNNVKNIFKGIEVSVLLELEDNKLLNNEGLKIIIHIASGSIYQYYLNCDIEIKNYYAMLGGSDIVYAYFETENNKLFVFDDYILVNIKNPPADINKDFWKWYYDNYAIYMPSYTLDECEW